MSDYLPHQIIDAVNSHVGMAVQSVGQRCLLHRKGDTGGHEFYWDVPPDYFRKIKWERTGHVGDGSSAVFSGNLLAPVHPATVTFAAGPDNRVEDAEVDPETGVYMVTFTEVPANGMPITVSYVTEAPLETKVWIEFPDKKNLPDSGAGHEVHTQLPLIAWLPQELDVQTGEWFEIPEEFTYRQWNYGSQFQIVSRLHMGQDHQALTSYAVAPRRDARPVEEEQVKETPPAEVPEVPPLPTDIPIYPLGDGDAP